jgi:hypothetical protein
VVGVSCVDPGLRGGGEEAKRGVVHGRGFQISNFELGPGEVGWDCRLKVGGGGEGGFRVEEMRVRPVVVVCGVCHD